MRGEGDVEVCEGRGGCRGLRVWGGGGRGGGEEEVTVTKERVQRSVRGRWVQRCVWVEMCRGLSSESFAGAEGCRGLRGEGL